METIENQNQYKSPTGKIILIAIVSSLLVGAAAGAAVYFWKDKEGKIQNAKIKACEDQQKEILASQAEKKDTASQNILPANNCPASATAPIVQFISGGSFTEAEKQDLTKKIITPFYDYQKDIQQEAPIVIVIEKYSDAERAQKGYYYDISSYVTSGYQGWLERKTGEEIGVWIPDCMGACPFSENYRQKHPEVVAKYNAAQR